MDKKNIGMLEAIEIAMEAESKANKFYLAAVKKTANERGKNLLQQLANFEQTHYDKLKELKNSLETVGEYIKYEGTKFIEFKASIGAEVSGKIEANTDDVLNILTLAIDAEKKAHDHYRKMESSTNDSKGKEMFKKLAEEETLHRRILSDEFYQISNQGGVWSWGD